MGENVTKVVPLSEVEGLMQDLSEIKQAVDDHKTSTDVRLSEDADKLAALTEKTEEVFEKFEKLQNDHAESRRLALQESGGKSFEKALGRFKGGFRAPTSDDGEYTKLHADGQEVRLNVRNLVEGVMLGNGEFYSPEHEAIEELRQANDDALLMHYAMLAADGDSYRERGGARTLSLVKDFRKKAEAICKAAGDLVDTSDLSNWVPTHFSSALYDTVRLATPEIGLWTEVTMPGKSLELMVNATDPEAQKIAEKTTITAANPFADTDVQAITDRKVTLTAEKLRSRIVFSRDVEEDAIVAQMPFYRQMLVEGFRNALADAIVNGDAGGDLDNTASSQTHFGKACPATGVDARTAWDGLRSFLADNTVTPDTTQDAAGADLSASLIASVRALMGEYGVDSSQLVLITSPSGYLNLVADSNFLTVDKMGAMATLLTGSIGKVYDIPVVVSRRYPQNLTDTDGKIAATGGTERTGAILVRRDKCVLGNRRRMTMGMDTYGATDTADVFAFWRGDFQPLLQASDPYIAGLIDILN